MNHYSNMSTLEYFLTCFSIAGVLWVFTCYTPTTYETIPIVIDCPSLAIKHGVGGNLKTYVQAVVDENYEKLHKMMEDEDEQEV